MSFVVTECDEFLKRRFLTFYEIVNSMITIEPIPTSQKVIAGESPLEWDEQKWNILTFKLYILLPAEWEKDLIYYP